MFGLEMERLSLSAVLPTERTESRGGSRRRRSTATGVSVFVVGREGSDKWRFFAGEVHRGVIRAVFAVAGVCGWNNAGLVKMAVGQKGRVSLTGWRLGGR